MDYYLEFVFPEKNIRYIAVTENEDTEKGLSDFVPFKNLFNEWFAKDTSRKVKAAPVSYTHLEIDTDIYVERNTSTSTKISMLRKFFKAYGANEEDLVFYLKDVNDDGTAQEAGTRYELRRRYRCV